MFYCVEYFNTSITMPDSEGRKCLNKVIKVEENRGSLRERVHPFASLWASVLKDFQDSFSV